ncbi:MAG: glycosyltransferase family 2 protein [Gammaproteobacteria bacterium]|jgi:dolichol-phosphate mannosyltransferase|nr:glycosyltransferase family 2 protein [Gammaproteobacteria bacterium]MBT4491691.1 glycosyltransferase family 2 protein [Gammaproteobacteria bacterium]MBT7369071.1 glycosyltransferase family 2 protein [Gammaproteobacteria bacterium]
MLTIVVPTYCEAENIGELVCRIDDVLHDVLTYELLVVDDNSPDDIKNVIADLQANYPVRLLQPQGRPRDLSMSVIDGVREAQNDLVLVMDADHSHPPEKIPEMFEMLKASSTSFVLGSRYVEQGSFDRSWSLWRFLNSHVATLLTRPLVDCADPMSGFFAFNRTQIDLDKLKPLGYKIGLELMVRGNFSDVKEVAIRFQDREVGESKMNLTQQFRFLRHLRRLYTVRFGSLAEFINYGAVGASGFIVDLFFYYLLQAFGLQHQWARAISFWPAVTWNWRLNRSATFGERKRRPRGRQWVEFVVTSLFGFSLNWGVYIFLTSQIAFFDQYRVLALIGGIGVASVFNFFMSSLYVYSEKRL